MVTFESLINRENKIAVVGLGYVGLPLAVHLAARIMGLAGAGEILVSRTVRDLVVGSELRFADLGKHQLKGIEDPWHLYALD